MELVDLKNIINNVKQNLENFWLKLNITTFDIVTFVSCFGIGFLLGLFLKRYVKYLILLIIFAVLLLVILQYFNIVYINNEQIKTLCGFSQTTTCDDIIQKILIFFRINIISVVCAILGCLLGFQVG